MVQDFFYITNSKGESPTYARLSPFIINPIPFYIMRTNTSIA